MYKPTARTIRSPLPHTAIVIFVTVLAVALGVIQMTTAQTDSGAPAHIQQAGVLRVGSQQSYVPAEFRDADSQVPQGFTVDLLTEITRRWGVDLEYVQVEYSALIPGLAADRFDMGSGGMSPNPDRLEAVEMVNYFQSGATFIIRKADEGKYETAQDFCGQPVGAIQGATTIAAAIEAENAECVAAGREPINLQYFTTTPEGLQQVTLGRIEAYLPDFAQTLYLIQQNPDTYATIGEGYYLVKYPTAWTFSKNDEDAAALRDAIVGTLSDMMEDGTYRDILERWGVEAGAILEPAVNSLTTRQG
jgi:polar amino acid transport system substrate-binding protein